MQKGKYPVLLLLLAGIFFLPACQPLDLIRVALVQTGSPVYDSASKVYRIEGRLVDAGEGEVASAGHVWGSSQNLSVADGDTTVAAIDPASGQFSSTIRRLDGLKKYFARAYVTLKNGQTSYGEPVSFDTPIDVFFDMVNVEGGSLELGSDPGQDPGAGADETPKKAITVSRFSIGRYEVTQALWGAIMGYVRGHNVPCDRCPITAVTQTEIDTFFARVKARTGVTYRLPTEAEWEFAARGGNKSRAYLYSGSNNATEVGWYQSNSNRSSQPVGQKRPNELGIYDMSGNIAEYCSDWYQADYYRSRPTSNPKGPLSGTLKVTRGGAYNDLVEFMRSANRAANAPNQGYTNIGFRLARN